MQIKNSTEILSHPKHNDNDKKQKQNDNKKCWRRCGGRKPSFPVGGILNWFNHSGNQCGDAIEKLKINPLHNHIYNI